MSGYQYQVEDQVVPVSDTFGEQVANAALYAVYYGCTFTLSGSDLTVACAAGLIRHFGTNVAISANASAWTLVPDTAFPRWAWLAINSDGTFATVSGDPAAAPGVPELGDRVAVGLVYVQANLTLASSATHSYDQRVPAPEPGRLHNYKIATQVLTTTTTLADVIGAVNTGSATAKFSFDAAAGGIYIARYYLPLAFGGTGGAKWQISGPTIGAGAISITGDYPADNSPGGIGDVGLAYRPITEVTAFATDIAAHSSTANSDGQYYTGGGNMKLQLRLVNGANAGAVTLQFAQNSSNSTSTIGLGATMDVMKLN